MRDRHKPSVSARARCLVFLLFSVCVCVCVCVCVFSYLLVTVRQPHQAVQLVFLQRALPVTVTARVAFSLLPCRRLSPQRVQGIFRLLIRSRPCLRPPRRRRRRDARASLRKRGPDIIGHARINM